MVKGPAQGYIYAIVDPDTGKYIWVGNALRPWLSIQRMLLEPPPRIKAWVNDLCDKYPQGIEVLGSIVCDKFLDPEDTTPLPPEGKDFRLEWHILALEDDSLDGSVPAKKQSIIKQLRDEGHPLLNGHPGRPRQSGVTKSVKTKRSSVVIHRSK